MSTRKAPAAKASAPKPASKETKPNGAGEAEKLIARWDFLAADRSYKASIAATEEEANTCFGIHGREFNQIADKLGELIPGSFYDALKLLWFVNSQTKDCEVRSDNLELKIIRNVTEALPGLKFDEIDKACKNAAAKTRKDMASTYAMAVEIEEKHAIYNKLKEQ